MSKDSYQSKRKIESRYSTLKRLMDVTEFGEPWLAYKAPFVQRNNGKRHINNYVDWVHFREKQNDVSGNRHNTEFTKLHNDGKVRSIL